MAVKKSYHVVSVHDGKGKAVDYESNSEYHNAVPSGAARKVFSALCRNKNIKGNYTATVVVRQKGKDKDYSYNVNRTKLSEPKELMGRTIEYGVNCTSNRNCSGSATKKGKAVATKGKAAPAKGKGKAAAATTKAKAGSKTKAKGKGK